MIRKPSLSRRALLKGAGSVAVALPFLDAMSAGAQSTPVPKRFVVWFTPNGFHESTYPTSMDFTGSAFEALQPFANDLIVTRGMSMLSSTYQASADHPTGFGHILTGDMCDITNDDVKARNISIDQYLAKRLGKTRIASSLHGVQSLRTMSWDGAAGNVSGAAPQKDPKVSFTRLFGDVSAEPSPSPVANPNQRRKSILDSVRKSYETLRCNLGGEDRQRLESHMSLIRDVETRLDVTPIVPGVCNLPVQPDKLAFDRAENGLKVGDMHMRLLVKALECDITRVGTMQWYSHTGLYGERYVWDELPSHHESSHNNTHGANDAVFAQQLATFLGMLKEARAEDGSSLLNHTVVLCVSELGINTQFHHLSDIGITVAGHGGGYLKTGQYIDFLAEHRGKFRRAEEWKRSQEPGSYFTDFDVAHNKMLVEIINAVSPADLEPVNDFGMAELGRGGLPQLRA